MKSLSKTCKETGKYRQMKMKFLEYSRLRISGDNHRNCQTVGIIYRYLYDNSNFLLLNHEISRKDTVSVYIPIKYKIVCIFPPHLFNSGFSCRIHAFIV